MRDLNLLYFIFMTKHSVSVVEAASASPRKRLQQPQLKPIATVEKETPPYNTGSAKENEESLETRIKYSTKIHLLQQHHDEN
jgi:hypothetical protein